MSNANLTADISDLAAAHGLDAKRLASWMELVGGIAARLVKDEGLTPEAAIDAAAARLDAWNRSLVVAGERKLSARGEAVAKAVGERVWNELNPGK